MELKVPLIDESEIKVRCEAIRAGIVTDKSERLFYVSKLRLI